ncbi:Type IV secretory pathway, VirD4 component, TraG/TraD family ATPase [Klenkia marina]|uniref:Type IV secretory pathway, VirD4 component, TraG/TraD family ATPase n=1 Tax=Klenkia marina TaxID=1960309 RepID=A0A1G4Z482_9ACTN|nr:type IV secretory system conjugative DNA transfer family protein [Klenkia marina]SCX60445.1 Type IV secretory pathway, VirD4 component, TraG/TraD family ATPase [Klenkia marina]
MSAVDKPSGSGLAGLLALLGGLLVVGLGVGALRLAAAIDGVQPLPLHPIQALVALRQGAGIPPSTVPVLGTAAGVLALLAALAGWVVHRHRSRRSRVDRAAAKMGRGRDIARLGHRGGTDTSRRLGVDGPGLPIGRAVAGGQRLFSSYEDVCIDIWGPRTGKTTSRAIPVILAAPGTVIATSNKRDLLDATRDPRAERGPVWVFDPQGIADTQPTWWWNPLTFVTDEVKARQLARLLHSAARDAGAKTDAYFDPAGIALLGNLLLAAACGGRDLAQVYLWLTDSTDDTPALLLEQAGYRLNAANVRQVLRFQYKQRDGIYGTAEITVSFLTSRAATAWVCPTGPGDRRPQLDVADFVTSGGTLYLLSKEGEGSTGPLVTALTNALTEAAETIARELPGGRLAVPMVVVLDEAANICRWYNLPDLYSHYGSRGIPVFTILQSWSQGVAVWGRDGMRKLWSASTVRVYGGGVAETDFLRELSTLVGQYRRPTVSTSTAKGGRSTSRSQTHELVLDIDDLADLPRGRAVVFSSGNPATLIRTEPWHTGPHAAAVAASQAAHDPAARIDRPAIGRQDPLPDVPTPMQLREDWAGPGTRR